MKHLVTALTLLAVILAPALARADKGQPTLNNLRRAPSTLMPLVDRNDVDGSPKSSIPDAVIQKVYDRCMSKMPERFTPDALKYYCTCSSAALQGNLRLGELADIQKDSNRVSGNKAYDKYVQTAVAPCLDVPVEEIEYLYCVIYKSNDYRISNIPKYCGCVSYMMKKHMQNTGDTNILIELANKNRSHDDPVEGLWKSDDYQNTLKKNRDECSYNYMKMDIERK